MRLAEVFENVLGGASAVAFKAYDGSVAGPKDAVGTVEVRSPLALRYVVSSPGDLGLARAYVTGALEVHGTLFAGLLRASTTPTQEISRRDQKLADLQGGRGPLRAPRPPLPPEELPRPSAHGRRHSKTPRCRGDQPPLRRVQPVLPWLLGPSMAYTCACFPREDATLEEAQADKFDLVSRKLRLEPGMRLLDVGCGWGGMVIHAAREYGVQALGVTLSRKQAEWAAQGDRRGGLSPSWPRCAISTIGT